jgi:hypothetical protein
MDVSTFYGFFSATCFTLVGLWWNVVQRNPHWLSDPGTRRLVGGVYLSFFLPALMGLFGQVSGPTTAWVWRVGFIVVGVVGCASTVRLLTAARAGHDGHRVQGLQAGAIALYAVIAVVGALPLTDRPLGLAAIQVEAILLILLIVIAHGLVWRFMTEAESVGPG